MPKKKKDVETKDSEVIEETAKTGTGGKSENTKKEPVVYEKRNGLTRPKPGGITSRVWEICDELATKDVPCPQRKDVLEKCDAEGIKNTTGTAQYSRWRKFYGFVKAAPQKQAAPKTTEETPSEAPPAPPEKA